MVGLLVLVLTMLLCWKAYAQPWYDTNQATLAWDEVTANIDGTAIGSDETVKYRLFYVNVSNDPNKDNPILVSDNIETTRGIITLNIEGRFYPGIQAVSFDAEGNELRKSEINWSDNAELNPNPFGLRHLLPLGLPINLRPVLE